MSQKRKIVFITGKGGVGKSTVAAAVALREASLGKSVALFELGNTGFYHTPNGEDLGGSVDVLDGVDVYRLRPMECLKEYISQYVFAESATDYLLESKPVRALLQSAPGIKELAILGKVTGDLRVEKKAYDLAVVDAFATGHFLALLRAPRAMAEAIVSGAMAIKSKRILRVLSDPAICEYKIVTIPEELPVVEAIELANELKQELHVQPSYICNKSFPQKYEGLLEQNRPKQTSRFMTFMDHWREGQSSMEERLNEHGDTLSLPFCYELSVTSQVAMLSQVLR